MDMLFNRHKRLVDIRQDVVDVLRIHSSGHEVPAKKTLVQGLSQANCGRTS